MLRFVHDSDSSVSEATRVLESAEQLVARARAMQIAALRSLDAAQVATRDGARSLADWTAARLDVSHDTARTLVSASKLLDEHPKELLTLSEGAATFDRTIATARLAAAGADPATVARSRREDILGVRRMAARRHRLTSRSEREQFRDRYLSLQPSLDSSSWALSGMLPGVEGRIVEEALARRGDQLPALPGAAHRPLPQRNADALASIAQDSLGGDPAAGTNSPVVTIFVDADEAGTTRGERGAEIAAGPRVGPATLERVLCEGRVQVVGLRDGGPVAASATSRSIRPSIRRFVLWRDAGCVVDGCSSRYRLQPHHVIPWSEGGGHEPDNLATLCWFHHHVAIHGSGFRLDPGSPKQRRLLLPPVRGPDPPY